MKAVCRCSGKQFLVQENTKIVINQIQGNVGDDILLKDILMIDDAGKITLNPTGAELKAVILSHFRDKKKIVYKKIRRHGYQRKNGHRQDLTEIQILGLNNNSESVVVPVQDIKIEKPLKKSTNKITKEVI